MAENIKKFKIGGIDIPGEKDIANKLAIKKMPFPDKVIIPSRQHIGKPGKIIVEKGDYVKRGQCLVEEAEGFSARIHASISGEISDICELADASGNKIMSIIIKKIDDGNEQINFQEEIIREDKKITAKTVKNIVRRAGIIGMGGAGFPSHIKLDPPEDKIIDTVIINGAECEPYISIDDRTMQEKPPDIFRGLDLIKRTVGAKRGIIACEDNKPAAIEKMRREEINWPELSCEIIDSRYPHGAEKKLIEAILNREIPEGGLPMDVGVLVNNVQTTLAITSAVYQGHCLIDRPITISGRGIANPANLIVPVGTTLKDIIDYCGGMVSDDCLLIMGGPLTGFKTNNLETPISKTHFGFVVLSPDEYHEYENRVCIRCGKCVDACPVYITPNRITDFINQDLYEEASDLSLETCIECGACAYVCPAKRPLLRWLKKGKAALKKQ